MRLGAKNRVTEADEVLRGRRADPEVVETLYKEKYISETELLADRLALTRAQNSLTVAKNDLEFLQTFTKQRKSISYQSDVKQAEMALERTGARPGPTSSRRKRS
jgi:HlyD family secretion protein